MDKEKEALRENEADRDKIAGRNAVIEALKAGREIDRILVAPPTYPIRSAKVPGFPACEAADKACFRPPERPFPSAPAQENTRT